MRHARLLSRLAPALLMGAWAVAAAAQELRIELDRPEISVEEEAVLVVTVEGAGRAEPTLSPPSGLELRYGGRRNEMEWINGRVSRRVVHTWSVRAGRPGEYRIGPAEAEVDGELLTSNVVDLRVVPASAAARDRRDVFVTAQVSDDSPFVGEQVVFVWRLFSAVPLRQASLESQDLGPFQVESLGDVRRYRVQQGGSDYQVSEIRRALFATAPGEITIPPWVATVEVALAAPARRDRFSRPFDDFLGRGRVETRVLRTEPLRLEVRSLPNPPPQFSGLIGDFSLDSSLSETDVGAGDSLTQRVTVSGTGNVQLIPAPELGTPVGFKVYDDQPIGKLNRSGELLSGSRTFTRALVPLAPGPATVPAVELVYFDPESEVYVRRRTEAVDLDVGPGSGREDLNLTESLTPDGNKVAVRILGDDILPIYRGLDALAGPPSVLWTGVGLAAPPLAFAVLLLWRRRGLLAADEDARRRREALSRARRALASVDDAAGRSLALRRYVGDRLGREGAALTPAECRDLLEEAGIGELAEEAEALLTRLERAQYGSPGAGGDEAAAVAELLDRLDTALRRRRR